MGKTRSSSVSVTKKAAAIKAKPKISHQKKAKPTKVQAKATPKAKAQKVKPKKSVKKQIKAQKPKASPKKAVAKEPKPTKAVKPAKQAKPKVAAVPTGYTADEYQKYKEQKKRLSSFNNADLKAMLKKNLQSMSGNKDELIQKIADGIVLGRIPRCPECFGGRPKYDYRKGTYHCSGYRDDEDFKNCHTDFTKQQLKRDPWQA